MSEEQLLLGDDAIHGEIAYYLQDDVVGVVPGRHVGEVTRGDDIETGNGSGGSHKGTNEEMKQD